MGNFDLTNLNITKLSFAGAADIFLLALLVIYTIYAVLVYKQVKILNKAIQTRADFFLDVLAMTHLIFSLIILVLAATAVLA